MIRNLAKIFARQSLTWNNGSPQRYRLLERLGQMGELCHAGGFATISRCYLPTTNFVAASRYQLIHPSSITEVSNHPGQIIEQHTHNWIWSQPKRQFHAAGSKVHYLDFRYRLRTNHLRLHLLIIRRQKMKKHRRRKFRRKFKALLAKMRLKREIAKEKAFRVELLSMIRRAETFDPREYALQKINEINNKPTELTREERLEQLKQLIRENRYQVDYIKPKHRRAEI